ncbi:MAG: prolipoprotein diacylglyceryl transferase [Eubacteriales bacterium]|nr:prolipoprotein diacylglyceryl transferase [Eubacteriales bacterium]
MDIAFPNLGIYLENVPKEIMIGNFSIALYGVIIALGMLAGILMAAHIAKRTGQNPDIYWDASIWLIVFAVIGARIYYVIFRWDDYRDDLLQIFNLRAGGLAIYGGVIAAAVTLVIFCKIRKQNFLQLLDTAVYGLILGQIIGRWGNFTNREVFGQYTDSLFAMRLPVEMVRAGDISESIAAHMSESTNYIQVHPTFLYESLWNLALLCLMLAYCRHRKFTGEIALLYFGGYGLGRAWIEAIRTDQLYLPGTEIPVSMVLGLLLFAAALVTDLIVRAGIKSGRWAKSSW